MKILFFMLFLGVLCKSYANPVNGRNLSEGGQRPQLTQEEQAVLLKAKSHRDSFLNSLSDTEKAALKSARSKIKNKKCEQNPNSPHCKGEKSGEEF